MDDDPAKERALSTNARSTNARFGNGRSGNPQSGNAQSGNAPSGNARSATRPANPLSANHPSADPSSADPSPGNARAPAAEGGARRRLAASGALLTTLTAVPAAVLVVPDAVFNVVPAAASALHLGDAEITVLLRATGHSLPALMLAVPLAAVAARRFSAWPVLLAGLAALLAGIGAARFVHSVPWSRWSGRRRAPAPA